jgi:hypothetical protein
MKQMLREKSSNLFPLQLKILKRKTKNIRCRRREKLKIA